MIEQGRILLARHLRVILIAPMLAVGLKAQQPLDISAIVHGVDASVTNRIDNLAAYTVTEHYAVFRGKDEIHPAAEMLVKTTYRKQQGKSYEIALAEWLSVLAKRGAGYAIEQRKTHELAWQRGGSANQQRQL